MGNLNFRIDAEFPVDVDVRLIQCSEENCLSSKLEEGGKHSGAVFHYVKYGYGYVEYGYPRKRVKLGKGDAFVAFSNLDMKYYPDKSNPWSYIWASVAGDNVDELLRLCGITREKPHSRPADPAKTAELMNETVENFDFVSKNNLKSTAYLMLALAEFITSGNSAGNNVKQSKQLQRFEIAKIFVNANYRLPLTVADVAENVCVSSSYLMSLFSKYAGMTLTEYLNYVRISKACALIYENEKTSLSGVSAAVGYSDPLYFSRVFKKIVGVCPREYSRARKLINPLDKLKK